MGLNLSSKAIVFRVKDANGTWRDYSRQVLAGFAEAAKMPDRQAGGIIPFSAQITLKARADMLPVDNYEDATLFRFSAETDLQIQATDGNFYQFPAKLFILSATPIQQGGLTVGNTLELGCPLRIKNVESTLNTRAMDIKIGGGSALSNLIIRAFNLAGIACTAYSSSGATLSHPRDFGNNFVAAAAKLLDSARMIAWSQPTINTPITPQGTGGAVYIDAINTEPTAANVVKTVDIRQGDMLTFEPFQEPRNPNNQALLANEYVVTSTPYAYRSTPTRTVDDEGDTTTVVEISFSQGRKTTTITEEQLGSNIYSGLPSNYPSGNIAAQVTEQTSTYNTSGDKALVRSEESTNLRFALAAQSLKGYLTGKYQQLKSLPEPSSEDLAKLAKLLVKINRYSWSNLLQGAREKIITPSYDEDRRVVKMTTVEKMTRAEILAGLGNGVDWEIVTDSPLNLSGVITVRTTVLKRFKVGGEWCERPTVTCLKCMGTEAHRADLNYRLAQAYQGTAPEGETPIPNEALYNQIIAEALTMVTMPVQRIRVLGNGETKPGSLDTMPERYTAEQVQVQASHGYATPYNLTLKQALSMEFPGDFSATSIGGELAVRIRQRDYARVIGNIVRARQKLRKVQKAPLWPEILTQWRPWMAIDVIDMKGVKYRCAFDGIRIMFSPEECYWEQELVQLGTVDANGNLNSTLT
jgi:hypothetical protein